MSTETQRRIDWSAPAYRDAPWGSLEHWQYVAATSIGTTDIAERDRLALAVGRMCFHVEASGSSTCVWHELTELLRDEHPDREYTCNCSKCYGSCN